jgi:hypothetical protein
MALVNPNIAMSYRAPEIQAPNQMAQYAQMQQIMAGQQSQQMNALKMQEARSAMDERNALRQLNPTAADYEEQLFKVSPQLGINYRKEQATTSAQQAAQKKSEFDLKAAQRKFGEDLKRGLSANPSDENIIAFGQDAVLQGLYTPEQVQSTVSQLLNLPVAERVRILSQAGASPGELKPTLTPQQLGGSVQVLSTPAFGGQSNVVPGSSQRTTITPGQAQANALAEQRIAQTDRRLDIAESKGSMGPELKLAPVHAQKAIVGAATSTKKIDDAIAALEAEPKEGATGLKGYLPNVALNRMYPEGTAARAAIADIGSLLIHDRSGAAVTASETPRLLPFVPQITDDKKTALTKLKRLRQIQLDEAEALAGTYTPSQGYREFKPGAVTPTAPFAAGANLSPAEQAELETLRKRFAK